MISKKIFTNADGNVTRFLSDFIIRSQDFARPYAYIYDNTLDPGGTEDQLQDGSTDQADWVWPDNIWKRGSNTASSSDLVTVDKWQVVDNSILFFTAPLADTTLWLEVATTAEEFGDTLTQASVLAAEDAALAAAGSADDAAASASSVAASSAQIETNRLDILTKLPKDGTEPMTGNLEAPSMSIGGVTVDVDSYGIEFGSNANGNYIKFADGTMICHATKTDMTTTASNPLTFPHVFIAAPTVTGSTTNSDSLTLHATKFISVTTTSCSVCTVAHGGTSTATPIFSAVNIAWEAKGRWK